MFTKKVLLITGGTGSFGNAILDRFLHSKLSEIRILSRDEKKQDDMRRKYSSSKLKFYIGDVRIPESINEAFEGADFCFHAAALKQVPSCEFYPMEALRTNVIGTENVLNAAIFNNLKRVICLSTDKAVYPINSMGISKAMMEKVVIAKSRSSKINNPVICITRYGNVMASRGSVIPLFFSQILSNKPISITDTTMTRFMMTLDEAVNLVVYAFENGKNGDIYIQKSPAVNIEILVKAILRIMNKSNHPIRHIGSRHGEKLYESLISREEMASSQDLGMYYRVQADFRDLNYSKYIDEGNKLIADFHDYTSNNTEMLDVDNMISLLKKLPYVQQILAGEKPILDN